MNNKHKDVIKNMWWKIFINFKLYLKVRNVCRYIMRLQNNICIFFNTFEQCLGNNLLVDYNNNYILIVYQYSVTFNI